MVMTQGQIRIWWDVSVQAYRLTSPYNKELVDSLKAFIPISDRSYDPTSKIWTISERMLTPTVGVLQKLKLQHVVITRQQAEQASTSSPTTTRGMPLDVVMKRFLELLPYESARKSYLHASMQMHPDKGGSMDVMTEFNALWQRLEKEVWKQ
jgi:hypothetical protein